MRYGSSFPDAVLYTLLLNVLPEDVAKEVRDKRVTLNTVGRAIDYLRDELARHNDKFVSELHGKQDAQALAAGPKNAVNAVLEPSLKEMNKNIQDLCAAGHRGAAPPPPPRPAKDETRTRLPKPDPAFGACWHCGKKHPGGRRKCKEFSALRKRHGGKLPPNYKGQMSFSLKRMRAM